MINILTKEFDFEIANLYYKKKLNCNYKYSINFYIKKKQIYIKHRPVVCHARYDTIIVIKYLYSAIYIRMICSALQ